MLEVLLFIGLQGAGKSTLFQQRFAQTHMLVSKDRLKNNRRPERRQQQLIDQMLIAGHSVVVDNTNATAAERAPVIATARAHQARVLGYYFTSPVSECRVRNAARPTKARIPEVALFATAHRLQPPSKDEGFDELWSVNTLPGFQFEITPR